MLMKHYVWGQWLSGWSVGLLGKRTGLQIHLLPFQSLSNLIYPTLPLSFGCNTKGQIYLMPREVKYPTRINVMEKPALDQEWAAWNKQIEYCGIVMTERHTDGRDGGEEISAGLQPIPQEDVSDWVTHSRNEDQLQQLHGRWEHMHGGHLCIFCYVQVPHQILFLMINLFVSHCVCQEVKC